MKGRLTLWLVVVPVIVWALFEFSGDSVSSRISARFASRILAGGDGKFTNAQAFVENRLRDGAVLTTAACLLILAGRWLSALVGRRLRTPARWIVQGWIAFVGLNVFTAVAAHTVLFWCLLFSGKDHTNNYTQWRIKQGLMKEVAAPSQAVLIGASQIRTQIDTKVLNQRLGRKGLDHRTAFPGKLSLRYDSLFGAPSQSSVGLRHHLR